MRFGGCPATKAGQHLSLMRSNNVAGGSNGMVSYINGQPLSTSGAPRAHSIGSRASSSSRRHRQPSLRHGRSPTPVQNEFPVFANTGDVEIVLASRNGRREQRYLLHKLILSQCSGWFEDDATRNVQLAITAGSEQSQRQQIESLSKHGGRDSSTSDTERSRSLETHRDRARMVYVLNWGQAALDEPPVLVQRQIHGGSLHDSAGPPPYSKSKPPTSSSTFFRSMSNSSALNLDGTQKAASADPEDQVLRDYDNLFRIFYNYPPSLNNHNIADAYTESKALLRMAEIYDALPAVAPRIDHHLLRFGNRLFKQIAKYPPSYLKLGYLAQSKTIFAEALIHVVGQWPYHRPQLERSVDLAVLDLIEDKYDVLNDVKAKVEGKLFRLTLTTSRGERVSPRNSFLDWLAMSLFRQWLAENTTPAPVSILKDSQDHTAGRPASASGAGTARIFRLIALTDLEAYLSHDELKRFLKHAPDGMYSRENLRRFGRRMDEIKNLARDVVKPVARNCLELDRGGEGLDYLTCTRVTDEDFPWDE